MREGKQAVVREDGRFVGTSFRRQSSYPKWVEGEIRREEEEAPHELLEGRRPTSKPMLQIRPVPDSTPSPVKGAPMGLSGGVYVSSFVCFAISAPELTSS